MRMVSITCSNPEIGDLIAKSSIGIPRGPLAADRYRQQRTVCIRYMERSGRTVLESGTPEETPRSGRNEELTHVSARAVQVLRDLAFLQVLLKKGARNAKDLIRSLEAGLGRTEAHHTWVVFETAGDTVVRQFQE